MAIHIVPLLKGGNALGIYIIDRAHQYKQVPHH
jgi:hypothetical protein